MPAIALHDVGVARVFTGHGARVGVFPEQADAGPQRGQEHSQVAFAIRACPSVMLDDGPAHLVNNPVFTKPASLLSRSA